MGSIRPGEVVKSIGSVAFFCVNRPTWDGLDAPELLSQTGYMENGGALDPYDAILPQSSSTASSGPVEHPCASLKRLLGMGSFYYAANGSFDISTRLEKRLSRHPHQTHDISQYDGRFVWNTFMIHPLMEFRNRLEQPERDRLDEEGLFLLAIQGYAAVFDMTQSHLAGSSSLPSKPTSIALVSRLSWKRAGTRFNTRGVDDDGNVANFVESETILNHEGVSMSYVQLRGSVPLFWEQQGLQTFSARIQVTRSRQASQPAFDRHFADLLSHYSRVHALNLLGARDAETILSAAYAEHIRMSAAVELATPPADEAEAEGLDQEERIGITNFDFHAVNRLSGSLDGVRSELKLLGPIRLKREAFSCTIVDSAGTVRRRQNGVIRTNCLDCLDRTNVVEAFLSEAVLEEFLDKAGRHRESFQPLGGSSHPLWAHHRVLWAENGDALSRIYAGTGALNTTYTRTGNAKKSIGSFLSDAAKSAGRMYINNFQDKGKQNVIDALLGNMANQRSVEVYDPLHDSVASELTSRLDEYSTKSEINVFVGTWNLNAKAPGESLLPWLMPPGMTEEPDIYAIGFQEIVPLSPQQILLTDPAKLRLWEGVILDTLGRRPDKRSDYLIMRSEQLVGTALVILVKSSVVGHIRQVEATTRKTGLKGMSGNKGGVAIRLTFHDSTFCFVTAHFAAGHSNAEERNADYWTIQRGLNFQRGKNLVGHDHVIWLGDFNYRIDLPNDRCRALAQTDDYEALAAHDQLRRAHYSGAIFPGFEEGQVGFRPTYKYDVGTDVYDSSEKQRVPAWTDRILYSRNVHSSEASGRGHQLNQTSYFRAEIKTSDHRPVYATFKAEVRIFDREKRNAMRREILSAAKSRQARGLGGPPVLGVAGKERSRAASYSSDLDDDEDDEHLPAPSGDAPGVHNWFDNDASSISSGSTDSSTGDESEDDSSSDSSTHRNGRNDFNPFRAKTRTLILRHSADSRSDSGLSSSSPPEHPSSVTTTKAGSSALAPTGRRDPPPAPPRSGGAPVVTPVSYVPRKAPPPRPSVPSSAISAASSAGHPAVGAGAGTAGESQAPPLPSRRPDFARSTSHSSVKSGKSLLDDSD